VEQPRRLPPARSALRGRRVRVAGGGGELRVRGMGKHVCVVGGTMQEQLKLSIPVGCWLRQRAEPISWTFQEHGSR
jgi:hypothetical protein